MRNKNQPKQFPVCLVPGLCPLAVTELPTGNKRQQTFTNDFNVTKLRSARLIRVCGTLEGLKNCVKPITMYRPYGVY